MKFAIHANIFKKITESIKDLTKDTSLEFSEDGVVLNAMDSSHVTLVHMFLKDSLLSYDCSKTEVISLNTETLSKILKTCENDAEITCENSESKIHICAITNDRKLNFSQNLLDLESDSLMIPEMDDDFSCKIDMPCSEYMKICRDFKEFGDSMKITVSPNTLKFYTDANGEYIQLDFSQNKNVKVETEAAIEMEFSLKYLTLFCKACALSENVLISIGDNLPMKVKFSISQKEHLSFYLAPKVSD